MNRRSWTLCHSGWTCIASSAKMSASPTCWGSLVRLQCRSMLLTQTFFLSHFTSLTYIFQVKFKWIHLCVKFTWIHLGMKFMSIHLHIEIHVKKYFWNSSGNKSHGNQVKYTWKCSLEFYFTFHFMWIFSPCLCRLLDRRWQWGIKDDIW